MSVATGLCASPYNSPSFLANELFMRSVINLEVKGRRKKKRGMKVTRNNRI